MHFTIRNICKKFKIQEETLRAFYYARIQREERERRERVSSELEKDERYKELQKEYLHSIQFPYPLLDPSGVKTYSAFQEKRERLLALGFFPWEDDNLYYCRRCHDKGSFLKNGKQKICSCWKKGIKKALLPYRRAIENLMDPESWVSLINYEGCFVTNK